jgi:thiamine-phosphate pyrophosphorylase
VLDLVEVRAKGASATEFVDVVERVRKAILHEAGVTPRMRRTSRGLERAQGVRPLVLANDRLDVALAAKADGVHVGTDDLPPEVIRELDLPSDFVVGLTCHTLEELRAAPGRGADYLGVGSFFSSVTKPVSIPDPRPALRRLPVTYPLPIYAIGGVTLKRLEAVFREPHVRGVVVSSAIQADADPAAAARAFRERLERMALSPNNPART